MNVQYLYGLVNVNTGVDGSNSIMNVQYLYGLVNVNTGVHAPIFAELHTLVWDIGHGQLLECFFKLEQAGNADAGCWRMLFDDLEDQTSTWDDIDLVTQAQCMTLYFGYVAIPAVQTL